MNDASAAKRGHLFGFQAHSRAEKRGNFREASTVAVSAWIAGFNAEREAEQNRFRVFEFVGIVF